MTVSFFVIEVLSHTWGSPSFSLHGDGFQSERNHLARRSSTPALPYISKAVNQR